MKVGFVGLGKMGKPMAMNMLKAGAQMIVASATDESFPEFRDKGARATKDVGETVEADTIFLCLPSSEVVRDVLLGELGIANRLRRGQTVIDTSTITYSTTLEVAKALEVGSGQLTKLINQLLFDINCAALAEILPMAVKMGLDCGKVGEVVNSGTGRSYEEFFIPRILKHAFDAGYPMKEAYKDLVSAAELGAKACIPMPVLAAATATYQAALLKGHGAKDKGGMIRVFEDLLGVEFRESSKAIQLTLEFRCVQAARS